MHCSGMRSRSNTCRTCVRRHFKGERQGHSVMFGAAVVWSSCSMGRTFHVRPRASLDLIACLLLSAAFFLFEKWLWPRFKRTRAPNFRCHFRFRIHCLHRRLVNLLVRDTAHVRAFLLSGNLLHASLTPICCQSSPSSKRIKVKRVLSLNSDRAN
jgi:hypothetical protein